MIDRDNNRQEETPDGENGGLDKMPPASYDEQEQQNSFDLTQRIEEENQNDPNSGDTNERIDEPSRAEEDLSGFLERTLPDTADPGSVGNSGPVTRNLRGDNPPGSEQASFENMNVGDISSEQSTYNAEDIEENFRENLDKTQAEIDLDKKLKNKE